MRTDRFLYLLLMVTLITLLYNLNTWRIADGLEAQYAEISREMLRSGDYLHPRLLAVDTYQSPPLPFWLMSLGMHLWGVNAFGVRFFSQIALVIQAILLYLITLRLFGVPRIALFSVLIYLSLPLVLVSTRILSPDIFLTMFELGAVYSLLVCFLDKKSIALYGLTFCLGLGFLSAGFRILLLPVLMGCCLWVLARPLSCLIFHRHHVGFALLLGGLLGGGWYVYVGNGQPDFGSYFWQQYIQSPFLTSVTFTDTWWQLPLALLCGSLPWLLILGACLFGDLWQNKIVVQLGFFWLLLPIVFLTVMGDGYGSFLTVAPGFAIVASYATHVLSSQEVKRYSLFFVQLYSALGLLAFGGPLVAHMLGGNIRLTWPLVLTAIGTLVVAIALFRLINVGVRFRLVAISLVSSLLLVMYSGYFRNANPIWIESVEPVVQLIESKKLQDLPILVFNETLPALAFNLDRDIITIDAGKVTPDVRFQTRRAWRDQWILVNTFSSMQLLRRLINGPSVLVVAGDLPSDLSWIKENYPRVEPAGRWQVWYRSDA